MSAAVALFALALLAKELAWIGPFLAGLAWLFRRRDGQVASWLRTYFLVTSLLVFLLATAHVAAHAALPSNATDAAILERLATFTAVYDEYVRKICLAGPWAVADTVRRASSWSTSQGLMAYGSFLVLVVGQILAFVRWPTSRTWIVLGNGLLVPVAQVVPILHFKAERFLYLPSLVFIFAVALAARAIIRRQHDERRRRGILACVVVCALVLSVFAGVSVSQRLETFRDDVTLFGPETRRNPDYREGLAMLAAHYDRSGDLSRAEVLYRDALRPRPTALSYLSTAQTVLRLTQILLRQRRPLNAIEVADTWLPQMEAGFLRTELQYNRAVAHYSLQHYSEALSVLEPYSVDHPADADCAYLVGMAAARTGRHELARRSLIRYLRLSPGAADRSQVAGVLRNL